MHNSSLPLAAFQRPNAQSSNLYRSVAMEDRGLKINRKKTVYLRFNVDRDLDDGNSDVNIQGENLERVNTFKYLGATLAENGDLGLRCGDDA